MTGWLDLSCRPPVGTVSCAFTVTLNGARCFYRLHNISRCCWSSSIETSQHVPMLPLRSVYNKIAVVESTAGKIGSIVRHCNSASKSSSWPSSFSHVNELAQLSTASAWLEEVGRTAWLLSALLFFGKFPPKFNRSYSLKYSAVTEILTPFFSGTLYTH